MCCRVGRPLAAKDVDVCLSSVSLFLHVYICVCLPRSWPNCSFAWRAVATTTYWLIAQAVAYCRHWFVDCRLSSVIPEWLPWVPWVAPHLEKEWWNVSMRTVVVAASKQANSRPHRLDLFPPPLRLCRRHPHRRYRRLATKEERSAQQTGVLVLFSCPLTTT